MQSEDVSDRFYVHLTGFSTAHMGFAGIEAFCAFLAVATHGLCQPRQESLFERNAAG